MVEINFIGRLGNNLFQYAFGRIIAEELNYTLRYVYTYTGKDTGISKFLPAIENETHLNPIETYDGHIIDLKAILSNTSKRRIVLSGYFQRYEYYQPYKERVKSWFHVPDSTIKGNSVICHIRREDFNMDVTGIAGTKYYTDILDSNNFDSVYVCGIGITEKTRRSFDKYNPIYIDKGAVEDLLFIATFPNIIMSNSTYSWWAAFLSKAKKIFFPITTTGYWSSMRPDINLRVYDEEKYFYIQASDKD